MKHKIDLGNYLIHQRTLPMRKSKPLLDNKSQRGETAQKISDAGLSKMVGSGRATKYQKIISKL